MGVDSSRITTAHAITWRVVVADRNSHKTHYLHFTDDTEAEAVWGSF